MITTMMMTTNLPYDYARCYGGTLPECVTCLRRTSAWSPYQQSVLSDPPHLEDSCELSIQPPRRSKAMTREEVIAKLIECQKNGDTEVAHSNADDVLPAARGRGQADGKRLYCEYLTALGYADVVAEYEKRLERIVRALPYGD